MNHLHITFSNEHHKASEANVNKRTIFSMYDSVKGAMCTNYLLSGKNAQT